MSPRSLATFLQVLIGVGALWMLSSSLQAQTTIWDGSAGTGGDGTWATVGHWSAGVPVAGNTTRFQLDATRTTAASVVDFTGAQSVGALQIGGGKSVTLEMADASSLTANGNGAIGIQTIGTGSGPASLTLQGPGTGSATYSHIRFDVVRGSSLTLAHASKYFETMAVLILDCSLLSSKNVLSAIESPCAFVKRRQLHPRFF